MTDMFLIRSAYKRDEVIILVPAGWKLFEPSRIIWSPSTWLVKCASHEYLDGDATFRKIIEDEAFYEQLLCHGMCYCNACGFGIKCNRRSYSRVSSGRYGILAPMTDELVDLLMKMGLKGLFRSSGWDLASFECDFMRIYAIDFHLILHSTYCRIVRAM